MSLMDSIYCSTGGSGWTLVKLAKDKDSKASAKVACSGMAVESTLMNVKNKPVKRLSGIAIIYRCCYLCLAAFSPFLKHDMIFLSYI